MTSINALCQVISRHIEESSRQRTVATAAGGVVDQNWWKIYESSILALCVVRDEVMEMSQAGSLRFDLVGFLDSVVLATLNDSGEMGIVFILPKFDNGDVKRFYISIFSLKLNFVFRCTLVSSGPLSLHRWPLRASTSARNVL